MLAFQMELSYDGECEETLVRCLVDRADEVPWLTPVRSSGVRESACVIAICPIRKTEKAHSFPSVLFFPFFRRLRSTASSTPLVAACSCSPTSLLLNLPTCPRASARLSFRPPTNLTPTSLVSMGRSIEKHRNARPHWRKSFVDHRRGPRHSHHTHRLYRQALGEADGGQILPKGLHDARRARGAVYQQVLGKADQQVLPGVDEQVHGEADWKLVEPRRVHDPQPPAYQQAPGEASQRV